MASSIGAGPEAGLQSEISSARNLCSVLKLSWRYLAVIPGSWGQTSRICNGPMRSLTKTDKWQLLPGAGRLSPSPVLCSQSKSKAQAHAAVGPSHLAGVDVDVGEKLGQQTLGHLHHFGTHPHSPGHASDPLDLPLVRHLDWSQGT